MLSSPACFRMDCTLDLQDSNDQYSPTDCLDLSSFDTDSLRSSSSSYSLHSQVATRQDKYEEKVSDCVYIFLPPVVDCTYLHLLCFRSDKQSPYLQRRKLMDHCPSRLIYTTSELGAMYLYYCL